MPRQPTTPPPTTPHKPTQAPQQRRRGASPWSLGAGPGRSTGGSIWRYQTKAGPVVWRIRYRDASGRRVLETLGPEPEWTRRRSQAELHQRLIDVDRNSYTRPDRVTFAAFADEWIETAATARSLKHSTLENYQSILRRHLLPAFGPTTLEALAADPRQVDHYLATKLRSGLSAKTVTNHLLLLQVMFKQAVRWRLIRHSPVADTTRPRLRPPQITILTADEIATLSHTYQRLEADAASPEQAAWWRTAHTLTLFTLATALRCGELIALQWGDVSLLDATIHVRRAIVRGRPTTPKSAAGNRTIHLGPRTHQLLTTHYEHSAYRADESPVFCHPHLGTVIDPAGLARRYLKPALQAAGITRAFRPYHDLRHTSLTMDAAAGNPAAYIQMKAGHSQASITERYIHAAQTSFPTAASAAERRLFTDLNT